MNLTSGQTEPRSIPSNLGSKPNYKPTKDFIEFLSLHFFSEFGALFKGKAVHYETQLCQVFWQDLAGKGDFQVGTVLLMHILYNGLSE